MSGESFHSRHERGFPCAFEKEIVVNTFLDYRNGHFRKIEITKHVVTR